MRRITRGDSLLLKQFKRWAGSLMKANPDYVTDPERLRDYVRGPNWNDPDLTYAHYMLTVAGYGKELLGLFERLRADGDAGLDEYRGLLAQAGIKEE